MREAHHQPGQDAPLGTPPSRGTILVRVRYAECDPMNVAHHGVYLSWMELARTELLRAGGVSYAQLEQAGTFLVIAKAQVTYRRPVIYDDVLAVTASVTRAGPAKIEHAYEVAVVGRHGEGVQQVREGLVDLASLVAGAARALTPIVAAAGETTLGCVDRHGRISRMPAWLSQVPPG